LSGGRGLIDDDRTGIGAEVDEFCSGDIEEGGEEFGFFGEDERANNCAEEVDGGS
jgi:hypothetical protein